MYSSLGIHSYDFNQNELTLFNNSVPMVADRFVDASNFGTFLQTVLNNIIFNFRWEPQTIFLRDQDFSPY